MVVLDDCSPYRMCMRHKHNLRGFILYWEFEIEKVVGGLWTFMKCS